MQLGYLCRQFHNDLRGEFIGENAKVKRYEEICFKITLQQVLLPQKLGQLVRKIRQSSRQSKWSGFATLLATTHLCAPLPLFSTFHIRKKHPRHHHHHRKLRGRFFFECLKVFFFLFFSFFSKRKIIDGDHHELRVVGNRQDPRGPVGGVVCGGDLDGPHHLFH
jgi:hypothetical protein